MKSLMNNKKYSRVSVTQIILILFLVSCTGIQGASLDRNQVLAESAQTQQASDLSPRSQIEISRRYQTSIPEIANKSDLIVIGKLKPTDIIINSARDGLNHATPDPNHFSIGHLYEVQVDQYLKGEGPDTLLLVIGEGLISLRNKSSLTREEIDEVRKEEEGKKWKVLSSGHPYLLFLKKFDEGDYEIDGIPVESIYVGAANPWFFDLKDKQQVVFDEPNPSFATGNLSEYFPPLPLDSIIEQINQPYSTPTPMPTSPPMPTAIPYEGPLDSPDTFVPSQSDPDLLEPYPGP